MCLKGCLKGVFNMGVLKGCLKGLFERGIWNCV